MEPAADIVCPIQSSRKFRERRAGNLIAGFGDRVIWSFGRHNHLMTQPSNGSMTNGSMTQWRHNLVYVRIRVRGFGNAPHKRRGAGTEERERLILDKVLAGLIVLLRE